MRPFMRFVLPAAATFSVLGMLTSCIDDKYDLSDIDTTTQLKVNDLTVPVNFKDIFLDKIIDIDDSDPDAIIKVREVNAKRVYVISKGGKFDGEPVKVSKVYAPEPSYKQSTSVTIPTIATVSNSYKEYDITRHTNTFEYRVGRDGNPHVDESIVSIASIKIDPSNPLTLTMSISSQGLAQSASRIELSDLDLLVPDGLVATYGNITSSNGHLRIPTVSSTNGQIAINIDIKEIKFGNSAAGIEVVDGMFDFSEKVGFNSGKLRIYPKSGVNISSLPATTDFTTRYRLTDFTVNAFSGNINYTLDLGEINPINLTDVPEFLAGDETDVRLTEAALALEINNPVAPYGLSCHSGLTLTPTRDSGDSAPITLASFTTGTQSINQFHVLGSRPESVDFVTIPDGLTPVYTPFPGLNNLLAGKGIPKSIKIDFKSGATPKPVADGRVKDFPLGSDLGIVHGEYKFEAPLSVEAGSCIIYSHTEDGWNDEDVDAIEVSKLHVTARLTSTIPAGAKVYIYPIDKQGNRIPLTNADEAYGILPALASDYEVSIELLGDIRHLDGIYIEAIINDFSGSALSPDMKIKVNDLKANVTGTYTKKL